MKASLRKPFDKRWLAGALVALAVVGILSVKALQAKSPALTEVQAVATGQVAHGPAAPTGQQPVQAQAPVTAPTVGLQPTSDAMPADPVGQLQWAQDHQKPVMVLFHSLTCIPCKKMDALVKKVRPEYESGIVFVDVITDNRANMPLIQQASVRSIPTSFFVSRSGEGQRFVGAMEEGALRTELDTLLEGE